MNPRIFCGLSAMAILFGCGPRVDRGELGTILQEPPQFDRFEQTFPLPQLGPDEPDAPAEDGSAKPNRDGSAKPRPSETDPPDE